MDIAYNDSVHIQLNKKELKDIHRWLSVSISNKKGLVYASVKKNPVKSAIGELYTQLTDFLNRGEDE